MENKNHMVLWGFIVVVIIVALVFLTIKHKAGGQDKNSSQNVAQNANQATGVQTAVISEGTGVPVKTGDKVSVNYTGGFEDGTVFDSNVDPQFKHVTPFIFTIGNKEVIPGWDQGIVGMKVGEKRLLRVSPELAYGASGYQGVIPPNATLIFQVELVSIIQ